MDEFYFEAVRTAGMNLFFQTTLTFQTFMKVQIPVSPPSPIQQVFNKCLLCGENTKRNLQTRGDCKLDPNGIHPEYLGTRS